MRLMLNALLCSCLALSAVYCQTKSALELDSKGWINLLNDRAMKDWIRGPLGGNPVVHAGQMSDPSPWKLDPSGQILICEGDKVGHEWLRYAPEFVDFVCHVEFRFPRFKAKRVTTAACSSETASTARSGFKHRQLSMADISSGTRL